MKKTTWDKILKVIIAVGFGRNRRFLARNAMNL